MTEPASRTKRVRATAAEVEARRAALLAIVAEQHPMTVRQVFSAATVRGIIEKTERGYDKVQSDLTELRGAGTLPYEWLADSTRTTRKSRSYGGMAEALRETARLYRRDLWADAGHRVQVWLEKDALANVVVGVTNALDVPLAVTRGYASLSFLHTQATAIAASGVPTFIYHLGDFDPSGVDAARSVHESLRRFAPKAEIVFERLAVTEEQIAEMRLPTRPTKASDSRSRSFGAISVELDAIEPQVLRGIVRTAIERHVTEDCLEQVRQVEADEKLQLYNLLDQVARG
jgi:hypothetical protein